MNSYQKRLHFAANRIAAALLIVLILSGTILTSCGSDRDNTESETLSDMNTEYESIAMADTETENTSLPNAEAAVDTESEAEAAIITEAVSETASETEAAKSYDITLAFTGDINLDDTWSVMQYAATQPNSIFDCIDEVLVSAMQDADLCCINNEFSFSARGSAMKGKAFTFRSDPSNVSLLTELGVDLATLANNHVYDYGADAFADTLTTLDDAGIAYVGAGLDLEEAMEPFYYEQDGLTIAVVNATRAEKNVMTPAASDSSAGVLRCYDTELFEQVIAEADANADFVICCVHWGTEYIYEPESVQKETARIYIDAGADVIVGTHSHCLQGIEYYDEKPIFYSLGNFWFNDKTLETGLLVLHLTGDSPDAPMLSCTFLPAIQEGCVTRYAQSDEDRDAVFGLLNEISVNAEVDSDGMIREISE